MVNWELSQDKTTKIQIRQDYFYSLMREADKKDNNHRTAI